MENGVSSTGRSPSAPVVALVFGPESVTRTSGSAVSSAGGVLDCAQTASGTLSASATTTATEVRAIAIH